MPIYSYACKECDHRFDIQQAFTDDALTECPSCQGRLRKVFNAVGVVFKGSGFYRTDSRASGQGAGTSGSNGSSGSTGDGASGNGGASGGAGSAGSGASGSGSEGKPAAGASSSTTSAATSPSS